MYDAIHRTLLAISLDNGGINRDRSEEQQKLEASEWLDKVKQDNDLNAYEAWLGTKTEEEIETLANGEFHDIEAMMHEAPKGLDDFLNDYFEEVC